MKRKFLRCSSLVNPNAVGRKTINGVEHIVVTSFTLPENIVMNGILYPTDEIDKSFAGLNRTLAPIEHPQNAAGQFVSANDPDAIHGFHAGAFNDNAIKVGNRIKVEKVINVQEAMKTDRGRRLLDRIEEVENSKSPRPIHTSTGIFHETEELNEPATNADGDEYSLIARNMVFDHDAILLDNIGAGQPHQGVGMAINAEGQTVDVDQVNLDSNDIRTNQAGIGHRNLVEQLETGVRSTISADWLFVVDVFDDVFIIETENGFFETPYRVDGEKARITGSPIRVERTVSYQPKTNAKEIDAMKDMILNALKAKGIDTDGLDDAALLEAHNTMLAASAAEAAELVAAEAAKVVPEGDAIATAITNALKPLSDKVDALDAALKAGAVAAKAAAIKSITNSKKYAEFDVETLEALPLEKVQSLAASCGHGYGLPLSANESDGATNAPSEMPE